MNGSNNGCQAKLIKLCDRQLQHLQGKVPDLGLKITKTEPENPDLGNGYRPGWTIVEIDVDGFNDNDQSGPTRETWKRQLLHARRYQKRLDFHNTLDPIFLTRFERPSRNSLVRKEPGKMMNSTQHKMRGTCRVPSKRPSLLYCLDGWAQPFYFACDYFGVAISREKNSAR